VDACLTLVNDVPEVIGHPQVVHDRLIQDVASIGPLIHMISTPAEFRLPPPKLGEHTRIVLEEAGLEAGKIAALADAGIIGIGGDRK
jgi:crotonobetainyl-CoA:carnitine CoA-transferase CaiB-like acyl-CoA transferase